MRSRILQLLMVMSCAALAAPACESRSTAARGAGNGVGIPRVALTLRGEPNFRGGSKLGFPDPAHPPEPTVWGHQTMRPLLQTSPLIVQAAPAKPTKVRPVAARQVSSRLSRRPNR